MFTGEYFFESQGAFSPKCVDVDNGVCHLFSLYIVVNHFSVIWYGQFCRILSILNLGCILVILLWFSDDRGLGLNVFWEHASSKYSDLKPSDECFSNWSLMDSKTLYLLWKVKNDALL